MKSCCRRIEISQQKNIHDEFWNYGAYQCGNVLISLMLKKKNSLTRNGNALKKSPHTWEYTFPTGTDHVAVCKIFLCNVLGVDKSRIENVQQTVTQNQSLAVKISKVCRIQNPIIQEKIPN